MYCQSNTFAGHARETPAPGAGLTKWTFSVRTAGGLQFLGKVPIREETQGEIICRAKEDLIMQAIAPALFSASGREPVARPREPAIYGRLLQAQTETHSSADFTFLTAEGDKVTLSADTLLQASYTRYDARGTLHGQRIKARAENLTLTSTQNSAITVEGELSQAELQDIQDVVQKVAELAQEVFTGTLTEPLDKALNFDDFTTLQSFDATLEYSQSLRLDRAAVALAPDDQTGHEALTPSTDGPDGPTPALASAPPLPATPPAADTATSVVQPENTPNTQENSNPTGVFGSPKQLFDTIKQAVQSSTSSSNSGKKTTVFSALAQSLSIRVSGAAAPRQQALSYLAAQFLQRLQELGRTEAPQPTPQPVNSPQNTLPEAPSTPEA